MADWFYVAAGESTGPVDEAALKQMFDDGALPRNTEVWQPGMDAWVPAHGVADFAPLAPTFAPTPPPAQTPLDFVITPVIPQTWKPGGKPPTSPQPPPPATAPAAIVKPSVVSPITPAPPLAAPPATAGPIAPAESSGPSDFLFTPVKPAPFGAPAKQIVRPGAVTSSGPKAPPPPTVPSAPQSPISFPPLPNATLPPPAVPNAPAHAPLPPDAAIAAPALPTAGPSRPPLQVPLWVTGAGVVILLMVILSSLTLPSLLPAAADFARGHKAEDQKDYAGAQRDYQAALVHVPASSLVLTRLGVVSMRLGDAKTSDWAIQRLKETGANDGSDGNAKARLEVLNTPEGKS